MFLWEILCLHASLLQVSRLVFRLVFEQRESDTGELSGQDHQGLDPREAAVEMSLIEVLPTA